MKISNADGDATSRRVIEEIVFQASLMALHSAIEAASNGGQPVQAVAAAQGDQLQLLVERARGPRAAVAVPSHTPDLRGF